MTTITSDETQPQSLTLPFGLAFVISGVVLLVWKNGLSGDFHFDDYGTIVENRTIRSLWPLSPFFTPGRPFGLYTFAVNYYFGQLEPFGYRLTNILIHLANTLLLYAGVLLSASVLQQRNVKFFQNSLIVAFVIALFWGLHPLNTQAVTNIVQRYESLSAMGYLGAWIGMLLVMRGQKFGLLIVLCSAWIGLLSKEVFATAPLVILLFDRWITNNSFQKILRLRWLAYLLMITPFLWFVPSVFRWFNPEKSSAMGFGLKSVSSWEYLRTQPEVILHYLKLSVWPFQLCFDYAWRIQQQSTVYSSLGLVIITMLVAGLVFFVKGLRGSSQDELPRRSGLAGWLILSFFIVLAPTSSFVPIADLCVEHRMYLPLAIVISGLILAGWQVFQFLEARLTRPHTVRIGISLGLIACLMMLGWRTHLRNEDYRNGIRLWRTVLQIRPDNPRAWFMLASEYFGRKRYKVALPLYQKAVAFQMPVAEFHAGLADCLRDLSRIDKAIPQYEKAIKLKPTLAKAHNGLGVIRHREGDLEAARLSFQKATDLELPESRYNLAVVMIDQRDYSNAAKTLEEALEEHPQFSLAARRLAWILATAPDEKLRDGHRAQKLMKDHFDIDSSDNPHVWDTQAAVLGELKDFDKAITIAKQALALADSNQNVELKKAIAERIESYRKEIPWREGGTL